MNKEELLNIVANAEKENRSLTDEEKALINKAVEERSCEEDKPKEEKSCGEKPKEEKYSMDVITFQNAIQPFGISL